MLSTCGTEARIASPRSERIASHADVYRPEGPSLEEAIPYRLSYYSLHLSAKMKRELGLDVTAEDARLAQLREATPTYAKTLVLTGAVQRPLYDHLPSSDYYFYEDRTFRIGLPQLTASQVQERVTVAFLRLSKRKWQAHFREPGHIDERFRILDDFDRVVMIGEVRTHNRHGPRRRQFIHWLPLPPLAATQVLKAQAARLEIESAIECSWDNFDSARGLTRETRDAAQFAEYGRRLIK